MTRLLTRALPAAFGLAFLAARPLALASPPSFNRDVRPILADKCFACHGPDANERQADLRLDAPDGAIGSAIIPGAPDKSPLIERILSEDEDDVMPPPESRKSLSQAEVRLLRDWDREWRPVRTALVLCSARAGDAAGGRRAPHCRPFP